VSGSQPGPAAGLSSSLGVRHSASFRRAGRHLRGRTAFVVSSYICCSSIYFTVHRPCAGSGVVRIDPLRFLAGCRKRRPNQALSVLSLSLVFFQCVCRAANWGPLFALCYFVQFMCSVSWLFLSGCQYQCK